MPIATKQIGHYDTPSVFFTPFQSYIFPFSAFHSSAFSPAETPMALQYDFEAVHCADTDRKKDCTPKFRSY